MFVEAFSEANGSKSPQVYCFLIAYKWYTAKQIRDFSPGFSIQCYKIFKELTLLYWKFPNYRKTVNRLSEFSAMFSTSLT